MRNGQNNKRMRNRNNNNNNNNNNRRGQNPMTRVFESNGPDIKIRGTASHVAEKYVQLARDARSSGDPVAAENYYQHAEHYFRLIAAAQEQFRQPYIRDNNPREQRGDNQPYQRDQQSREHHREREQRPQPQYQPQPQPQPVIADTGGVDRLPSFITGPQPQVNGAPGGYEGGSGGERFPRRRRRPHGPRPDNSMAAPAGPGEDFNPGNE
jgi:hypothetical protein